YPVARVELGEEPDGQYVPAEDFAALYLQFAAAAHGVDPALVVGGPSLQDGISDVWLQEGADRSWTHRFIAALAANGRLAGLGFFWSERYRTDTLCEPLGPKLSAATTGLAKIARRLREDDAVPQAIPWYVTEYGASAFGGEGEVDLPGALANAD